MKDLNWKVVSERLYNRELTCETTFAAEVPGGWLYRHQVNHEGNITPTSHADSAWPRFTE